MKKQKVCLLLAIFALLMIILPRTSLAAPYFEGKKISIIVGFAPGGGYDRMARILAKHLPKYIPGRPAIVIETMEGAASMIAANHIYNIAKPDGLTLGTFERGIAFAQLLKTEGVRFDLRKYSWVGSTAVESTVLVVRTDLPYKTFADLQKVKEPIHFASSGVGTQDTQFPILIKEFLGVNAKLVVYPSSSAAMLALERKEVDGRGSSYSTIKPYIERGLVRPLIRGRISEPEIENLPVDEDLTTNQKGKTFMAMSSVVSKFGRPYVAPPGTPAEIMDILRNAFAKAAKDPELQAEAKKSRMEVEYVSADECLKVLNYLFNQPDDIVREFGRYVKF